MPESFSATFKQLTIKGDATITLVLDPQDMYLLPTLAKMAGKAVIVGISEAQQQLDFHDED